MKDLQDFLERTTLEKLNNLSEKTVDNAPVMWSIIKSVYRAETKLDLYNISEEEINELFTKFTSAVVIHTLVRQGFAEMEYGRLKLSCEPDCAFKLTERGHVFVENKLTTGELQKKDI